MKRSTQILFSLCLTGLVASCGTAESAADKAEHAQKDASYSGDVKTSGTQIEEGKMIDASRKINLTGDRGPSNLTLFRDVVTSDASGSRTRCLTTVPDNLLVAKVFCGNDKTKAAGEIRAGQLPKYCVMLGEETPAVTELTLPCDNAQVAPMVTTPALFLGLR